MNTHHRYIVAFSIECITTVIFAQMPYQNKSLLPEERAGLEWWNPAISRMDVNPGEYEILIGRCSVEKDLKSLSLEIK